MSATPINPFDCSHEHDPFISLNRWSEEKIKKEKKPRNNQLYDIQEMEKMSLEQLEQKINELNETGKMSIQDEDLLRKIRRRVQNKWSSKEYRKRKKWKLEQMTQELNFLKGKCEILENENNELKRKLKELKIAFD
ncbi:hypothetical protein EDI_103190 [Entamoeba dispar SAW760]|uniref:BZIP domain-containing protein n=1 Tax=Entamoeba dispar (strain ATCC PRA-260 / SAW760) TaxID=370354 RepID=B0EK85_ENTDS|nr:uncharacterized protein EDI_103190 [Entamoeba dispar SAW760]EDR25060.1 hypothetical protein EDI_103190 [Entamoeba dispar SAW760]|eukprot:EDR25060.1 hypothetical protein EDI_103190 [Entamoeba dispar SAW760]